MPTMPKPEKLKAKGKPHVVATPGATPRLRGRGLQARNARLYRRNPLCPLCLEDGKLTEVEEWHHVVHLAHGGAESRGGDNLVGLCKAHHLAKHAAEARERQRRGG
jgi:5-methylcytosine-specific restriction endonuclease McrA